MFCCCFLATRAHSHLQENCDPDSFRFFSFILWSFLESEFLCLSSKYKESRRGLQTLSMSSFILNFCTREFQRLSGGLLPKTSLENGICSVLFGMDPKFSRGRRERNFFLTLGHNQVVLQILKFNCSHCYLSSHSSNCGS